MAEDKTLLKKDLGLIIRLNSKLHYNNIEEVKKIYQTLVEKNMFVSSLGQRYLKKLELIIQGKNNNTCLFCGKQCTAQSVICSECLAKMQPQNETKSQTEKVSTEKEAVVRDVPISEKIEEQSKTVQDKGKNKKKGIIKIAVILIIVLILISIGLDTVFTILMLVSLGILIYNGIKKKPKRNAAIAFVVFFILTGVTAMFDSNTNSTDFAKNDVDINTFLAQYEKNMNNTASELSDEDFSVRFILASEEENRKTYQIQMMDSDCGSIQFVYDEQGNIYSICGYSTMNNSIGAFIMINLVQTIQADISSSEAEQIIADSNIVNANDTYNIDGDYAYAYFNDADGLMLMITTKEIYMENVQ